MEDLTTKIGIKDKKLQRLLVVYGAFSVLFLAILAAGILLSDYARSNNETEKNLERIRSGLVRIEGATKEIRGSIVTVEKTIPVSIFKESPELQVLSGLDDLKGAMRYASIHVTEIGATDNKIVLPVTIRGFLADYSTFVNDVGRLQAMRFPFMNIRGIQINKEETGNTAPAGQKRSGRVVYEITGELLTLAGETGPAPPQQETGAAPARLWMKGGPK